MHSMVRSLALILLVAFVALLSGCGGGGGGAAAPASGGSTVVNVGPTVTVTGRVSMPGADKSGVLVTLARAEGAQAAAVARMIRGEMPVDATLYESPSRGVAPDDVWYGLTDADGAYTIPGVPPGNYFISARKGDVFVSPQKSLVITEANRQTGVESIDLELTPAGSLRGRVLFSPDLSNKAGVFCYVEGTSHLATTDANGNYLIRGVAIVPPYTYRVTFMKPGFNQAVSSVVTLQTAGSEVTVPDVTLTFNMGSDAPQLTIAPSGLTPKSGSNYFTTSATVTYTITVPSGAQAPLYMALPDLSSGALAPSPGVDAAPDRTFGYQPFRQFATPFTLTFPAEATYANLSMQFVTAEGQTFTAFIPGTYTYDKTAPRLAATQPVSVTDDVDPVNGSPDHFYGFRGYVAIHLETDGSSQNPEAAEMWVSLDNFSTGAYVPFDYEPALILPDAGTSITVSIRLRDHAGNVTTTTLPVTRHLPTGLVSGLDNVAVPRLPVTFSSVTNEESGLLDPLVRLVFDDGAFLPIPYHQATYATVPASGRISGYSYTPPATGDDVVAASHVFQGKTYTGQAAITFIGLQSLAVTPLSPAYAKYGFDTDLRDLFSNPRVTHTGVATPMAVDPAWLTFAAASGTITGGHLYRPAVPSGNDTITVTYSEGASSVSTSFTVTAYTLNHLTITTSPDPFYVEAGIPVDLYDHIAVLGDYSNGETGLPIDRAKITFASANNYPISSNGADVNPSVYTAGASASDTLTITVADGIVIPVPQSISIVTLQSLAIQSPSPLPVEWERGVPFDLSAVVARADFSNGSVRTVAAADGLAFSHTGGAVSGTLYTPQANGADTVTAAYTLAGVSRQTPILFTVYGAVDIQPRQESFAILVGIQKPIDLTGTVVYSNPAKNRTNVPFAVTASAGAVNPLTGVFTAPPVPGPVTLTYTFTPPDGTAITKNVPVTVVAEPVVSTVQVNGTAVGSNPVTTGFAELSWTLDQPASVTIVYGITSRGDGEIDQYEFAKAVPGTAPGGKFTLYDLSDGTRYYFRLIAVNAFGVSSTTTEYSFVNEFAPPASPVLFEADPAHPTPAGPITANQDLPLYTFQVVPGAGEPVVIEEIVIDATGSPGFDYTKLRDLRLARTADGSPLSVQTVFDGGALQKRFRFKVNRQFSGGAVYKMTLAGRVTEAPGMTIQFQVAPLLTKIRGVNTGASVTATNSSASAVLTIGAGAAFVPSLGVNSIVFGEKVDGLNTIYVAGVDLDPVTGMGTMANDGMTRTLLVGGDTAGTSMYLFPDHADWEFDPAYHVGLNNPSGVIPVMLGVPVTAHMVSTITGNKVVMQVTVNGPTSGPAPASAYSLVVNSISSY